MRKRRRSMKFPFQKWILGKAQFFAGLAAGLILAAMTLFLIPSKSHHHRPQPLAKPQARAWAPAPPPVAVGTRRPAPRKATKKVSRSSRKRLQSGSAINEPRIRLIKKSQWKKAYKAKKRSSKKLARPSKARTKRIGRAH